MRGRFTSKLQGIQLAERTHVCLTCLHAQPDSFDRCPRCSGCDRVHFPSKVEYKRGMELLMLRDAKRITELRFHPRFDLVVNGRKLATYVADADYREGGEYVVEDTKPVKFMDATAKLKIALFEALNGVTVRIPQRKTAPSTQRSIL